MKRKTHIMHIIRAFSLSLSFAQTHKHSTAPLSCKIEREKDIIQYVSVCVSVYIQIMHGFGYEILWKLFSILCASELFPFPLDPILCVYVYKCTTLFAFADTTHAAASAAKCNLCEWNVHILKLKLKHIKFILFTYYEHIRDDKIMLFCTYTSSQPAT